MQLIKAEDPEGVVVCYIGSFSRSGGPGLRLGWLLVPDEIYRKCERSNFDRCCSPSISQMLAINLYGGRYLQLYGNIRDEYKKRGLAMIGAAGGSPAGLCDFRKATRRFYPGCQLQEP